MSILCAIGTLAQFCAIRETLHESRNSVRYLAALLYNCLGDETGTLVTAAHKLKLGLYIHCIWTTKSPHPMPFGTVCTSSTALEKTGRGHSATERTHQRASTGMTRYTRRRCCQRRSL